jgi:hypothetical protein
MIDHPDRGAGSAGTAFPQTRGELQSTTGFIALPEGRPLVVPRVPYASPCMQLCS